MILADHYSLTRASPTLCRYRLGARTDGSQPSNPGSIPGSGTMIKEKIKKVWEILKTNHKIQIILVVSLTMVIALVIAAFLFWPEKQFKSTIDRYKININAF